MTTDNIFEGQYYDGRTARRRPCLITLKAEGLLIAFTDDLGPADTFWHLEGIHPAEFNDAAYSKLQFGPYPREGVEVSGRAFYDALRRAYPQSALTRPSHAVLSRFGWRGIAVGVAVSLALLVSAYVWFIPALADQLARQLPRVVEHRLGGQLVSRMPLGDTDPARTADLRGFIRHLRLDPAVPIEARAVKGTVVNAFATLGGYLHFYQGLLDSLNHPDQLAGLVAHEYAHAEHRHVLRRTYQTSANYIVIGALFGDASGTSALVLQAAEGLGELAFSRDDEAEADATARRILTERGLPTEGMAQLFELLKRDPVSSAVPEWLSTHPDLDARIAAAREASPAAAPSVAVNADSLRYYFDRLKAHTPPPAPRKPKPSVK